MISQALTRTVGSVLTLAGALVIGMGVPVFWIWVGSHLQKTTAPSAPALVAVIAGMAVTYMLVIGLIAVFKSVVNPPQGRRQAAWMRSMRDSPLAPQTSRLDDMVVLAAVITTLTSAVLLLIFGDPGTRPS